VEVNEGAREYMGGPDGKHPWDAPESKYLFECGLPGRSPGFRELADGETEDSFPTGAAFLRENADHTGKVVGVLDRGTLCQAFLRCSTKGGIDLFRSLSLAMGRLLPDLPPDVTRIIPRSLIWHDEGPRRVGNWEMQGTVPRMPGREDARWFRALFEVAWQNHSASPLRATRHTWEPTDRGLHILPADEHELRSVLAMMPPLTIPKKVSVPPTHYYSDLPISAFLASVCAIDLLLDSDAAAEIQRLRVADWAGTPAGGIFALAVTDIVGATALRQQDGVRDHGMDKINKAHFDRGRKYVQDYGGHVVKTLGDGLLCLFRTAASALSFALAFQRDTGDPRVVIRAAVHIGEVRILAQENDIDGESVAYLTRLLEIDKSATVRVSDHAKPQVEQSGIPDHAGLIWSDRAASLKDFGSPRVWIVAPPSP
jgi:class 3 adenylate cyclase